MDADDPGQSDEQYEGMLDRVETLSSEFTDSRYFDELTQYQQQEATFVVESVGELLYGYEDSTIEACDKGSLETVCTRIYPAKISVEPDHFGAVAPVVAALFRFLADRGYHSNGDALAAYVEDLNDEIVAAAADPSNWGLAKSTAMGEPSSGIAVDGLFSDFADIPGDPATELPERDLTPAELAAFDDAINSLSTEARAVLETVTEALVDPGMSANVDAVFDTVNVTPEQYRMAMDEALSNLEESDVVGTPGDDDEPSILDTGQAERFLALYGRLLVYVNDRFDVVPEIDTYEQFRTSFMDEVRPIRDRLYHETDTEAIIAEFVAENPAGLPESELSQIEKWIAYEAGKFAVVEHRADDTVFLDPEQPRAFGVKAIHEPFSQMLPAHELPIPVSDVVLLPFEGTIVTDGWLRPDPILQGAWEMITGTDLDTTDEEARHRYGVADSLPPAGESKQNDAEKLRFYTKNRENRERFADEIEQLRDKSEELTRIYHQQVGKGRARSLGREFRELGLEEAYVAIYDEQVVATAPTESALRETLSEIMPPGAEDHPYIYHYDP